MKGIISRWIVNTAALLLTAAIVQGIVVDGLWAALIAAAVLGIVNAFIRPVIMLLTLPFNILTLGLMTFVINGLLLLLVASAVAGFDVQSIWAAIVGSLLLSVISSLLSWVVVD